jgi:hypothetical protein
LIARTGDSHRTTRRWQAAMSRAALRLAARDDDDLRVPIALALLDFYGEAPDDVLAALVDVLVPIEALAPP